MKLKEGTILNNGGHQYKVESVLGSGGFGITYKVTATIQIGNIVMDQAFALKEHFVKKHCERDATGRVTCSNPSLDIVTVSKADFIAEAQRLKNLHHPNIVKVKEVFEENNTAYYAMEYLNGDNLRNHVMSKKRLTISEAFDLLMPICDAVKAIHKNQTTHLDIKPANVMLNQLTNGLIKPMLIDFGLSKHYNDDGQATSTMRTQGCSAGYSPVEQYVGIESFSPQSDIYSLAATFVFCLTGKRPPVSSELEDEVSIAKLMQEDININVRSAIVHAMLQSRKKRTQNIDMFVDELRNGCKDYIEVCKANYYTPQSDVDESKKTPSQVEDKKPIQDKLEGSLSGSVSSSYPGSASNSYSGSASSSNSTSRPGAYPSSSGASGSYSRSSSNSASGSQSNSYSQGMNSDSSRGRGNSFSQSGNFNGRSNQGTPSMGGGDTSVVGGYGRQMRAVNTPGAIGGNQQQRYGQPQNPTTRDVKGYNNKQQSTGQTTSYSPGNIKNTIAPQDREAITGNGGFIDKKNNIFKVVIGVIVLLAVIAIIIVGIVFYTPSEVEKDKVVETPAIEVEAADSADVAITDSVAK